MNRIDSEAMDELRPRGADLLEAYRALARAVVQQAVSDVRNPVCPASDRHPALEFLGGTTPWLAWWAGLAGLDHEKFRDAAGSILE
jgi:hypothetical protein